MKTVSTSDGSVTAGRLDNTGEERYWVKQEDDPNAKAWFRFDEVWRYLPDGQYTTVDREVCVSWEIVDEWSREGWMSHAAWELLDDLRTS